MALIPGVVAAFDCETLPLTELVQETYRRCMRFWFCAPTSAMHETDIVPWRAA